MLMRTGGKQTTGQSYACQIFVIVNSARCQSDTSLEFMSSSLWQLGTHERSSLLKFYHFFRQNHDFANFHAKMTKVCKHKKFENE